MFHVDQSCHLSQMQLIATVCSSCAVIVATDCNTLLSLCCPDVHGKRVSADFLLLKHHFSVVTCFSTVELC